MSATTLAPTRERRIALVQPAADADDQAAHALRLFDSILWVFKGTTQSDWTLAAPETAQVIVVHHADSSPRIAEWRSAGKLIVVISTNAAAAPASARTLIYPFTTAAVLNILQQLDVELDTGAATADATGPRFVGSLESAGDAWSFVESLRTVRAVGNADMWLVAKNERGPVLWLQGDGARYCCTTATAAAIRSRELHLSSLTLQKGAAPSEAMSTFPGSELAWREGYHASANLAPWMKVDSVYRLLRWPDLGRLRAQYAEPRAEQIRVLAELDAVAVTPAQLAQNARASIDVTHRTLNALSACGLLEAGRSGAQKSLSPAAASIPRGGLKQFLSSIRRHLGLGVSA